MDLALDVTIQVIIIFLLMGIGFIFNKTGKLTSEGIKQITNILLTIVTPCVLIDAYQKKVFNQQLLKELVFAAGLSLVVQLAAILIGKLIFKKDEQEHFRINIFSTAYSNCGFMAIPLLSATMGEDGVFYGSAYLAVFSVLSWTHGIYVISGERSEISAKNIIKNPGVMGTVIALLLFFLKINLPSVLSQTVSYVAGLNTPLAMFVLGTYLVGINLKKIFSNRQVYLCLFLRLIAVPLIAVIIAAFIKTNPLIVKSILIPAACPVAAICTLFAAKYGKDAAYATEIVASSTLVSIITIPVVIILASLAGI